MAKKITYADIFDFSNPADLKKAIKAINDLNKVYKDLEKTLAKGSASVEASMKNTVNSADELEKELKKLSEVKKEEQKQIQEYNNKAKALSISYENQKKKVQELQKQEQKLKSEREKLSKENQKITKQEKERIRLQDRLAKSTGKDAQETAKLKIQIQEANKATKERAKEALGLVSIYQKESARLNDLRKRYKEVALSQGASSKEAKKLQKEAKSLDKQLKSLDSNVGQNQRLVGAYGDALSNTIPALGAVRNQVGLLFKLIATNPIGLLITALVGLAAAFAKTQKGADLIAQSTEFISAVFDELVSRVAKLGSALVKFISFDFKGAAEDASAAIDDIGNGLLEAGKAAKKLKEERQEFRDREREINVQLSKNRSIIQDLILITRERKFDEETIAKQRKALLDASALELKNEELKLELAQKRLDFAEQELKNNADGLEDQELQNDIAEARVALFDAQASSRARQRDIANRQIEFEARITNEFKRQKSELDKIAKSSKNVQRATDLRLEIEEGFTESLNSELDKRTNAIAEASAKQLAIEEEAAEKRKLIQESSFQAASLIGNQLFTNANIRSQNELTNFKRQKEVELELAGENAQARAAIEAQIAEKEKQVKIKQAKDNKKQAIFNIGISTAEAILKNSAQLGFIPAIPVNIATLALGSLQAGLVASQPLPQFEDGGFKNMSGDAIVGEKGYEYSVSPSGKLTKVGANGAEVRSDIEKGSFIIPHHVSKALDDYGMNAEGIYSSSANSLKQIIEAREDKMAMAIVKSFARENDILAEKFDQSIKNVPQTEWNISDRKLKSYIVEGNTKRNDWRSKNRF